MVWATADEIIFLQGLGSWKTRVTQDRRYLRLRLLEKYRKSLKSRSDWGSVDRAQIEKFLIETLEGVGGPSEEGLMSTIVDKIEEEKCL